MGRILGAAVAGTVLTITAGAAVADAAPTASISGSLYEDQNQNGQHDAGEPGLGSRTIYVIDETGYPVAGAGTAADGSYTIDGLEPGTYRVEVGTTDWWDLRGDWVPTTTDTVWFRHDGVAVADGGTATADFGLRPIGWSSDANAPLSSATTAAGATVHSYVDAITAAEVAAALDDGTEMGDEAPLTTVRFGLDTTDYAVTNVDGAPGTYSGFSATVYVAYLSWLDQQDALLFHEYGHAWANYHDRIVQQDGTYASYLEARGLTGDSRLGSGHAWSVDELIAEDYRQLFGTPTAASVAQENQDIPAAADVAGLEDFLRNVFTQAPSGGSGGSDSSGGSDGSGDPAPEDPPAPTPLDITDLAATGTDTPTVTIDFTLSIDASAEVRIIDRRGKVIRTLLGNEQAAGPVSTDWDRRDNRGREVSDGNYTIEVVADTGAETDTAAIVAALTTPDSGGSSDGGSTGGPGKGGGKGGKK